MHFLDKTTALQNRRDLYCGQLRDQRSLGPVYLTLIMSLTVFEASSDLMVPLLQTSYSTIDYDDKAVPNARSCSLNASFQLIFDLRLNRYKMTPSMSSNDHILMSPKEPIGLQYIAVSITLVPILASNIEGQSYKSYTYVKNS